MTEDAFEPAACRDPSDCPDEVIVTDQEFASWVERSQAATNAVLEDWDAGAGAGALCDWDNSVEFYQELPDDDETLVFEPVRCVPLEERSCPHGNISAVTCNECNSGPPRRRRRLADGRRQRQRSGTARTGDFANEPEPEPYGTVIMGRASISLPEEFRDGGVVRFDDDSVVYLRYTNPPCPHMNTGLTLKLLRPGGPPQGSAVIRCLECGELIFSTDVQNVVVGYDT